MRAPCLPGMFSTPTRLADTSLDAFGRLRPTLTEREIEVYLHVCFYTERTGFADVTGRELAEWCGLDVLSVRPRLTGLLRKGWLASRETRDSRVRREGRCHPVAPLVPREAVERARRSVA